MPGRLGRAAPRRPPGRGNARPRPASGRPRTGPGLPRSPRAAGQVRPRPFAPCAGAGDAGSEPGQRPPRGRGIGETNGGLGPVQNVVRGEPPRGGGLLRPAQRLLPSAAPKRQRGCQPQGLRPAGGEGERLVRRLLRPLEVSGIHPLMGDADLAPETPLLEPEKGAVGGKPEQKGHGNGSEGEPGLVAGTGGRGILLGPHFSDPVRGRAA